MKAAAPAGIRDLRRPRPPIVETRTAPPRPATGRVGCGRCGPAAGELDFAMTDRHRGVRCLVRVDPDDHVHEVPPVLLVGIAVGTPTCGSCARSSLEPHHDKDPDRAALRSKARPVQAGRRFASDSTETLRRYGTTRNVTPVSSRRFEDACGGGPLDVRRRAISDIDCGGRSCAGARGSSRARGAASARFRTRCVGVADVGVDTERRRKV